MLSGGAIIGPVWEVALRLLRDRRMVVAGMAATALGLVVAGALYGPVRLSLAQLGAALAEWAAGDPPSDPAASAILLHVRLPRVVLGLVVGGGLALSGCALQGMFRNPLADPGLIGVVGGATVGAVTAIVLGGALFAETAIGLRPYALPLMAFVGAATVTALVFQIAEMSRSRSAQGASVAILLLAGVAVQAVAGAYVGAMAYLSDDQQLRDLTFWTMGGLGGADWPSIMIAAILILIAGLALISRSRTLDLFQLGERAAFCSGVDVAREKRMLGVCAALGVAAGVAVAGPIGFVGLVAPHMARLMVGQGHVWAMPMAALTGAALILGADLAVRTVAPPAEPPIGLATSLIGGPFFLWLLMQRRGLGHA